MNLPFFCALSGLALTLCVASSVEAGCGRSKSTCFHYKDGKLLAKGACTITECANAQGALERWDGRKPASLPSTFPPQKTTVRPMP